VAGGTFLVTLILLQALDPADFGLFAFLLVTINLGASLSNALVGAPLAVLASRAIPDPEALGSIRTVGLALAAAVGLGAYGCSLLLGSPEAAFPAAIFGTGSTLRWNMRSVAFSALRPELVLRSDLSYALVLLFPVFLAWSGETELRSVMWGFALASLIGWVLASSPGAPVPRLGVSAYRTVWRDKSRWTLLGVITTDATANAHAYLVTALAGPAAFALMAAAMIAFRPVGVMSAALVQYERPRMARAMVSGDHAGARARADGLRLFLFVTWVIGSAIAALFAIPALGLSSLLYPSSYDPRALAIASMIWAAIWLVRVLREPPSALLQAAGDFRPLALASCVSAVVSVLSVLVLLALSGPVATLIGLLMGEIVFLWGATRLASRLHPGEPKHG